MTPLAANPLQPLIDVCEAILKFGHDQIGLSWGFSIIFLTVVVRLAILPLTFKQVRSMQDLQRLQPEIKRLQERYKDDRQRMQQEMMRFYQEHQVNPLSSCLPLLLQLPFFLALFYLLKGKEFKADIKGEESFLFIPDLADKVTGHPGVLATLIVLYVATQLGASLVTAFSAEPMQRRIMLALPFIFVIFIINFEAGLIVYWITTNVWTIGQQLLVKKLFPKPPPIELKDDGKGAKAKPAPAGAAQPPEPKGLLAKLQARATAAAATDGGGQGSSDAPSRGGARPAGNGGPRKPPPPSPRKKKKRSGRRR